MTSKTSKTASQRSSNKEGARAKLQSSRSGANRDPCDEAAPPGDSVAPCIFVLFGATGDLTHRKIVPALYSLWLQKLLPKGFTIVAFARRDKTDNAFREDLRAAVAQFSPQLKAEGRDWNTFARQVFYVQSNFDDEAGYKRLSERLDLLDTKNHVGGRRLYYLATPPDYFELIIEQLGKAGLNNSPAAGWTRIIIEKPFGVDLESARKLNSTLGPVFPENQIYRIDHYLGKETVQNILVLRFANQIFEPLWNTKYIDNIQITVAETLGMEGRGDYFDKAGITRDIVQNHALQVLTLIGMEPPVSLNPDAIRDEKVKILRCMRPFSREDVANWTVRGQYGPAAANKKGGESIPGYRQEEKVAPDSTTETFAAFRFHLDNWRWAGVPFYVQAGKRLAKRSTSVRIQFKAVPEVLFARLECSDVRPNVLTLRIQPDEGASLEIGSKSPGPNMQVHPVNMDFEYGSSFAAPIRDAYERLILDAVRGDASLFARNDEVEAAWSLITPILDAWRDLSCPLFPNYSAGSWGPESANKLLKDGAAWSKPV